MPELAIDLNRFKHYPPPQTVPNGQFTYGDYKRWDLKPNERVELIHGVAYMMAAPRDRHQAILVEITRRLANFLEGKPCKVRPAPYDVRLFYKEDETDDTVVQPDISVICDEKKRGEEGCHGAPDLIIEILSPSNSAVEMQRKLDLYREAGVREYWVVDPDQKSVIVHLLKDGQFTAKTYKAVTDGGSPAKLPSAVITGFEADLPAVFSA